MMPEDWSIVEQTIALAALDVLIVWGLARVIVPAQVLHFKGSFIAAAALFWGSLALILGWAMWDSYYQYFYPPITRWLFVSSALVYAAMGWALWWLALRLPGNPVVNLVVLGALEAVPEHLWAIYGLGMLDRVPMMQGIRVETIIAFAVFEYALYWSVVVGLAHVFHEFAHRRAQRHAGMI